MEQARATARHVVGERALHVGHHDGVYSGEPEVELDRRAMRQSDGADIRNMEGGQVDGGGPVVIRDRQFAQAEFREFRASEYRQFAQANTVSFSRRRIPSCSVSDCPRRPIENSLTHAFLAGIRSGQAVVHAPSLRSPSTAGLAMSKGSESSDKC